MNFSPSVKAWLMLATLVLSSGVGIGIASYTGGASWQVSLLVGLGAAATNVYHALSESPKAKISKTETNPPQA